MTKSEFKQYVAWVMDRYPGVTWDASVWVAMYDEIARYEFSALMTAANEWLRAGHEWPMNTAQVIKACAELGSRIPALAPPIEDPVTWREFAEAEFGEYVPFGEVGKYMYDRSMNNGEEANDEG